MIYGRIIMFIGCFLMLVAAGCSIFTGPATFVDLPTYYSDNMVFQRDAAIPVLGTAEAGKKITIIFAGQKKRIIVPQDGTWRVDFAPLQAGGPHSLAVKGKETVTFNNILIGDIWIASGQSNMEWPFSATQNMEQELANTDYPDIRLLTVEKATSMTPKDDITSTGWQVCSAKTVVPFSAIAYFFGRDLHQSLKIPIGLINSSWGGTIAEAWTSGPALKELPDFKEIVEHMELNLQDEQQMQKEYEDAVKKWDELLKAKIASMQKAGAWEMESPDVSAWKTMQVPVMWEKAQVGLDTFDGVVWFRKEIDIPAEWQGQDLILNLGPIDDFDVTFFNGTQVGHVEMYNKIREYKVSGSLVKSGRNVIAVQVVDTGGGGGIYGQPFQLTLENAAGGSIPLAGQWHYLVGPNLSDMPPRPQSLDSPNRCMVLYNAMIAPLAHYPIRGAIWYQGESNAGRAFQYQTLFPALIRDWRKNWGVGDFSFYFVQLANYKPVKPDPAEDDWAELREAQLMSLSEPNTGMAVIIDIGDAEDIHPRNKQDVGKRLALIARAKTFGENIEYSGPMFKSMEIVDNKIRLTFNHAEGGLVTRNNEEPTGFAIAGEDHKFVWAKAQIENNSVIVWSPKVAKPVAVRYAWQSNPVCNLYNQTGLPASPFRTDTWPGITVGVK